MALLIIDVQHGLGNRLRAMTSAATIAQCTGRDLVVVWRADHHCEGLISQVLEFGGQ